MSHNSVFIIIGVFFIDSNMITVIVELFVAPNALISLAFDELSNVVDSDELVGAHPKGYFWQILNFTDLILISINFV